MSVAVGLWVMGELLQGSWWPRWAQGQARPRLDRLPAWFGAGSVVLGGRRVPVDRTDHLPEFERGPVVATLARAFANPDPDAGAARRPRAGPHAAGRHPARPPACGRARRRCSPCGGSGSPSGWRGR
jgi:hypothetical protein